MPWLKFGSLSVKMRSDGPNPWIQILHQTRNWTLTGIGSFDIHHLSTWVVTGSLDSFRIFSVEPSNSRTLKYHFRSLKQKWLFLLLKLFSQVTDKGFGDWMVGRQSTIQPQSGPSLIFTVKFGSFFFHSNLLPPAPCQTLSRLCRGERHCPTACQPWKLAATHAHTSLLSLSTLTLCRYPFPFLNLLFLFPFRRPSSFMWLPKSKDGNKIRQRPTWASKCSSCCPLQWATQLGRGLLYRGWRRIDAQHSLSLCGHCCPAQQSAQQLTPTHLPCLPL